MDGYGNGYYCSSCGQWVCAGVWHSCGYSVPAPPIPPAPIMISQTDPKVVELLERIAKAVEELEKRTPAD